MKKIILTFILFFTASIASATVPLGGLAVSVSPDGKIVALAGDNRTLYAVDSATGEVKQRVWIETTVVAITFNKDGTKLFMEDTDGDIIQVDVATWKVEKKLPEAENFSAAPAADMYAGYNYSGVNVFSLLDGSAKAKITIDAPRRIDAIGLSPDGKTVAVLTKDDKDTSEAKNQTPSDLKDLAKEEFEQKNDGKTGYMTLYDAVTGAKKSDWKSYYTAGGDAKIYFSGENIVVLSYDNVNAQYAKDGTIKLFQAGNSYNYGIGASTDQKILATGGMGDASIIDSATLVSKPVKITDLPGWPEYFKSFATASDGTIYGTTTAYRLVKIKPDGIIEKITPIF